MKIVKSGRNGKPSKPYSVCGKISTPRPQAMYWVSLNSPVPVRHAPSPVSGVIGEIVTPYRAISIRYRKARARIEGNAPSTLLHSPSQLSVVRLLILLATPKQPTRLRVNQTPRVIGGIGFLDRSYNGINVALHLPGFGGEVA